MTARSDDSWQVQDAKQHFSALIRAAEQNGTQYVTRHGERVVAVVPIVQYRKLAPGRKSLGEHLLSLPRLDDDAAAVFDEIADERRADIPRDPDLATQQ
jgi:prevent-host-death family protein